MPHEVPDNLLRVHRHPERGTRERTVIDAILDAGFVCHLGVVLEGRPVVLPTLYGRDGDRLVLHGSSAARSLRTAGMPVCVTVTLVDGLVLARSAFHHSANYRSVVIHGQAEAVHGDDDKRAALRVLTEHVAPGRWDRLRAPTEPELRATSVLTLSLAHATAKVRAAGLADDPDDLDAPVWAGVVPLRTHLDDPEPDPGSAAGLAPPRWTGASGVPAAPRTAETPDDHDDHDDRRGHREEVRR